ncbi:MAG: hypothetical protein ABI169_15650 [Chitinophagaceae bacterium]
MKPNELQQHFFRQIKSMLPTNLALVDQIADLLNISMDSAYRRIRGEKSLSFEEIQHLSAHYKISLDALMKVDANSTVFYGTWLGPGNFNFEQYLKNLLLLAQNVNCGTQKMIYYEAKDLPPFHYFHFPELAAFKYFFWMKTILNYAEYNRMCFEDNDLQGVLQAVGKEIIQTYTQIPTVEIWSVETINSSIRQIEYYREAGVFRKKESIDLLYEQLAALLEHVREQAEIGEKFLVGDERKNGPKFQLFFNDAYLGHNTILTETDGLEAVFINHGVLNLMMTHDTDFCANTRRYFENTMKKSALISSVNDRERNRFFKAMQEKVQYAKTATHIGQREMLLLPL